MAREKLSLASRICDPHPAARTLVSPSLSPSPPFPPPLPSSLHSATNASPPPSSRCFTSTPGVALSSCSDLLQENLGDSFEVSSIVKPNAQLKDVVCDVCPLYTSPSPRD